MSEHAEVKQEHRREAKRFYDAVDFLEEDELAQFLADHDAEVERKARLDEHDKTCGECMFSTVTERVERCSRWFELGGTNV